MNNKRHFTSKFFRAIALFTLFFVIALNNAKAIDTLKVPKTLITDSAKTGVPAEKE